jgi:hypothetical protein
MTRLLRTLAFATLVGTALGCSTESVELAPRRAPEASVGGSAGRSTRGGTGAPVSSVDNPTVIGAAGSGAEPAGAPVTTVVPVLGALPSFTRDDRPQSGLSADTLEALERGQDPCSVGIAYPTEGSLFPGGLLPPTIMWPVTAEPSAGASLHVYYEGDDNAVDYRTAVDGFAAGQLVIPPDAWREITTRTNSKNLRLELKISIGGSVQACRTHWRIARGNMTGSLFYYQSATNQGDAFSSAITPGEEQIGIFRLRFGAADFEPFLVPDGGFKCVGCHSMNARGTKLVALRTEVDPLTVMVTKQHEVYDVAPASLSLAGTVDNAALGALTPDGDYMLTLGAPDCSAGELTDLPPNRNLFHTEGPAIAKLVDLSSGQAVAAAGLDPEHYLWMPQFSPDGTKVVFNHAKPDPGRPGFVDRRELAVMDYDRATHTFSNLQVIVSRLGPDPTLDYKASSIQGIVRNPSPGIDGCTAPPAQASASGMYPMGVCTEPCYPAWPSFTPDNKGVIFTLTDQPDFNHSFGRSVAARAHLYYVEIQSGQIVRLDNAMQVADPMEWGFDNYTTVLPVSAGGYAWLFWTGRRSWGTRGGGLFRTSDPMAAAPTAAGDPNARKIWVSAIALRGAGATSVPLDDPSSPAFYLEGQGSRPSMRAFAALNPCSADGAACGSGVDCCAGFCAEGVCGAPSTPACSKIMDACVQDSDCCQMAQPTACFGGFCDIIVLE